MIGLNVLGMPVPDVPPLIDWLVAAKPPYTLVMDNLDLAARASMTGTQVIYRRYRADDHRLHETTTPAAFLESVADVPASYIIQASNEPGGDMRTYAAWTAELMARANVLGRRLAVGNFSVGNPDEGQIQAGWYDAILRGLAGSRHVLSTHEYFWEKPATEPRFIGRYRWFLQRADKLGIQRPVTVITEHGRDWGGGPNDGWRGQGWTEADYARRLQEAQTVYKPDGVCALVFCYGPGFDARWQSFNVEGAHELLTRMAAMNDGAGEGKDVVPGYRRVTTMQAGATVNVRSGPGLKYAPATVIKTGDWVKPIGAATKADGYTWQPVAVDKSETSHVHGYVALEVVTL